MDPDDESYSVEDSDMDSYDESYSEADDSDTHDLEHATGKIDH